MLCMSINQIVLIETDKSKLWVSPDFTPDYMDEFSKLELNIEPPIFVYGKKHKHPRNVGFYSDQSIGYRYSGQLMKAKPLFDEKRLQQVLDQTNQSLGTNFNGILVNQYMNGQHYIGAHGDDERGLDKTGKNMVACISYGAVRKFRIRNKSDRNIVLDYDHKPCTLLVMEGDFQKEFTHEIPVQKNVKEQRISLTFRHHTV